MENPFTKDHFRRVDESRDTMFYAPPRLLKHIDEPACEALADFYAEHLPPQGRILDLMSAYVSHLPSDNEYERVIGHGMNATLPFADESFDACIVAVSIQYLTRAVDVFNEVARVLRPGAPFTLAWSNRCFPTKAVAIWQRLDDGQKGGLIDLYFQLSGQFEDRKFFNLSPNPGRSDPLYVMMGRKA